MPGEPGTVRGLPRSGVPAQTKTACSELKRVQMKRRCGSVPWEVRGRLGCRCSGDGEGGALAPAADIPPPGDDGTPLPLDVVGSSGVAPTAVRAPDPSSAAAAGVGGGRAKVGGSSATESTAIIFMSPRFSDGSEASAVPIAFRSEHSVPVGIETSMFITQRAVR